MSLEPKNGKMKREHLDWYYDKARNKGLSLSFVCLSLGEHRDLTLRAGLDTQYRGTGQGNILTEGADLLAGETITLSGNAIALMAATNQSSSHTLEKEKSFTVGARLAGPLGNILNALEQAVVRESDNDRLKGAYALKAGYDAWKFTDGNGFGGMASNASKAAEGVMKEHAGEQMAGAGGGGNMGIGVQLYTGSSKSKSEFCSQRKNENRRDTRKQPI